MGRKKSYDRDALVAKAVEVFRDHGYASTSTQMLVEALGVNRFSMYAEFGSKQGLFDAALARYDADVIARSYGPLEAADSGLADIRALLRFYGTADATPAWGRGCFLCNTAVELGPLDPTGAGFVQAYFDRLSRAFRTALGNAKAAGELRPDVDVKAQADFLTSSVLGLFVMLRAKASPTVVESASRVAVAHLDTLTV